jgi:PPM family protein phosphatase
VEFAALTHPGNRAGENQDNIGCDADGNLWFVADGMGGHAAGEVASLLVKETLLAETASRGMTAAMMRAHEAVLRESQLRDARRGMGSTVVALQLTAARLAHIAWVGDSRAYLWRGGRLQRLTRDHSYLEMLLKFSDLSEAELRGQQGSHVVTQALGMGVPEPSEIKVPLRRGDLIILCSDGLTVAVSDDEIAQTVISHSTPQAAVDALFAATMAHGAQDNVSIIAIAYDGPHAVTRVLRSPALRWLAALTGMMLATVIFLLHRR